MPNPAFDGRYRYIIKINVEGIQEEEITALEGCNLLKYLTTKSPTLQLVSRVGKELSYFHMEKKGKRYDLEMSETRTISRPDTTCLNLLWDEQREPYITPIKKFSGSVGGFQPHVKISAYPKLIDPESCMLQNMDFLQNDDWVGILLHDVRQNYPEVIEELESNIKSSIRRFQCLEVPRRGHGKIVYFKEYLGENEISIPFNMISKGTRYIVVYLLKCLLCKRLEGDLVVIEDIEYSLHPSLIGKLLEIIQGFDVQVIITTHSPLVLDYLEASEVRVFIRDESGNVQIHKGFNKVTLANELELDNTNETNILDRWYRGDDRDLIMT